MSVVVHAPIGAVGSQRSACGQLGLLVSEVTEHRAATCPACLHWLAGRALHDRLVDLVAAAMCAGAMYVKESLHTELVLAVAADPNASFGDLMRPPAREFLNVRTDFREDLLAAAAEVVATAPPVAQCRVCGCTDEDCSGCMERTGQRCSWAEPDLCTACVGADVPAPVTMTIEEFAELMGIDVETVRAELQS